MPPNLRTYPGILTVRRLGSRQLLQCLCVNVDAEKAQMRKKVGVKAGSRAALSHPLTNHPRRNEVYRLDQIGNLSRNMLYRFKLIATTLIRSASAVLQTHLDVHQAFRLNANLVSEHGRSSLKIQGKPPVRKVCAGRSLTTYRVSYWLYPQGSKEFFLWSLGRFR